MIFCNQVATDTKLSKAQIFKIIQPGFLRALLSTLAGFIIKITTPLANKTLLTLGLTAAASTTDPGIHKKFLGSGKTLIIILNEGMEDIIKIANKSLEDSSWEIKGVTQAIENEMNKQIRCQFIGTYVSRQKFYPSWSRSKSNDLKNMRSNPSMWKNGVYSRNRFPESNLNNVPVIALSACAAQRSTPQINDRAYVINLDK